MAAPRRFRGVQLAARGLGRDHRVPRNGTAGGFLADLRARRRSHAAERIGDGLARLRGAGFPPAGRGRRVAAGGFPRGMDALRRWLQRARDRNAEPPGPPLRAGDAGVGFGSSSAGAAAEFRACRAGFAHLADMVRMGTGRQAFDSRGRRDGRGDGGARSGRRAALRSRRGGLPFRSDRRGRTRAHGGRDRARQSAPAACAPARPRLVLVDVPRRQGDRAGCAARGRCDGRASGRLRLPVGPDRRRVVGQARRLAPGRRLSARHALALRRDFTGGAFSSAST